MGGSFRGKENQKGGLKEPATTGYRRQLRKKPAVESRGARRKLRGGSKFREHLSLPGAEAFLVQKKERLRFSCRKWKPRQLPRSSRKGLRGDLDERALNGMRPALTGLCALSGAFLVRRKLGTGRGRKTIPRKGQKRMLSSFRLRILYVICLGDRN